MGKKNSFYWIAMHKAAEHIHKLYCSGMPAMKNPSSLTTNTGGGGIGEPTTIYF